MSPQFLTRRALTVVLALLPLIAATGQSKFLIAHSPVVGNGGGLWVLEEPMNEPRRILDHNEGIWNAQWSPDGTRIAFSSASRDGTVGEVYVVDADGRNLQRLTDHPALDYQPSWSPDGKRIVFSSRRNGRFGLFVMDADGRNVELLTNESDVKPSWSPDGNYIAFISFRTRTPDMFVMRSDGTDVTNVTNSPIEDEQPGGPAPNWSRDSYRLMTYSSMGILMVDRDGSNYQRLFPGFPAFWHGDPIWSPDERRIAYYQWVGDNSHLYTMNLDGSDIRPLLSEGSSSLYSWFDPGVLPVSPNGKRPFTWGWLKELGTSRR